jgi:hypothetical protein
MSVGQSWSGVAAGPYDGPGWGPQPPRSRAGLAIRFVLTVVYFPLHVALFILVVAIVLVCAQVAEVVCTILPFLEKHAENLFGRWLEIFPLRPRWWVSWPEIEHEGDAAYFAKRVEKHMAKRTKSAPKGKSSEQSYDVHRYRAIGAGGLLEIAQRYGWHLDESKRNRPTHRIHLRRPGSEEERPEGQGTEKERAEKERAEKERTEGEPPNVARGSEI